MIYLDNAATSFPKPSAVREAVARAMTLYSANPGRSGHPLAVSTAEMVYRCREAAAGLFGAEPERVVFTLNCTHALNLAIKGAMPQGGHLILSDLEHNAVFRPAYAMRAAGWADYTVARVTLGDDDATVAAFRRAIRPNTAMIVCTMASNVVGYRPPVERLAALAHQHGLIFVADAAQAAGTMPIDIGRLGADFLCMPGHKGLYGPTGTGLLIAASDRPPLHTLCEGGTGSRSADPAMPEELPDRLESGTVNTVGIAGLLAGIQFVRRKTPEALWQAEMRLVGMLYDGLSRIPGVRLYTPRPAVGRYAPVLSFNLRRMGSEQAAAALAARGFALRAGLHCAPLAHRHFDTLDGGMVRVSPGAFNTPGEIERFVFAVRRLAMGKN